MEILNDPERMRAIDSQDCFASVDALADQCTDAFEIASKIKIPENYRDHDAAVFCGMGGSGLGARIIETLFFDSLDVPLVRVNGYDLPGFAGEQTLVFVSSYSGNTEEVISCLEQALERGCMIVCIASGGKLAELAQQHDLPCYIIEPIHNPSGQPRLAVGYSLLGQLALARSCGLIKVSEQDVAGARDAMRAVANECSLDTPLEENPAKQFAQQARGRVVLLASAGHLVGAVHTVNNQFNENAKTLSADFPVPELNHHLMEGLKHPPGEHACMLLFSSKRYPERLGQRIDITRDVVEKNEVPCFVRAVRGPSLLAEALAAIQFGAFANLYLAMLYEQDPAPIPWVDYFKKQLGQ